MDKELYKRSVKKIKELRDDPMKLEAAMGRATSDSLPILNDAMQGTVTRAFTYLSEKVPELAPQAPFDLYEPEPTPEQMENFDAAVRVINDPINTYFYHLATNTLSPQVTEPFQAIYPDLYARVTDAAMEKFIENRKELPYASRVQMGLTYGANMESTVSPEFVAMNQQLYAAPGQEQDGGVSMTQGGVGQLRKSAAEFTTPMQAIEGA